MIPLCGKGAHLLVLLLTLGQHHDFGKIPEKRAKRIVKYTCKYYSQDPLLMLAILAKETKFKPWLCYKGAHGIGQIQLRPRNCLKTRDRAVQMGLYKVRVGIRKAASQARLWKRYCKRHHGERSHHHWLLHYNQGMGRCPKRQPKCSRKHRVPVTSGKVGGYARRVLKIKKKLLRRRTIYVRWLYEVPERLP